MHLDRNHTLQNGNRTVNGSTPPVKCTCVTPSTPQVPVVEEVEIEAFMYIVVVIVFYATSIVFLLIKYARNDDEEKNLKYQYSEFVKRERFQAPQYKNKLALERTKVCLENISRNDVFGYHTRCPVITVTKCSNESETSSADSGLKENGGVYTDTDTMSNGVDDGHANENPEKSPRGWIDKGTFSEPLSPESVQGGTSLSYDSGVDYLERLGMDDWAVYDRTEFKDPNSTGIHLFGNQTVLSDDWPMNTTFIPRKACSDNVTQTETLKDNVELEAFLYIVVVVVFYAVSITFLLIKYAKNYHEEKDCKYHYSEFVKRDRFSELQYQNKVALERTRMKLENIQCNSSNDSSELRQFLSHDVSPRSQSRPVLTSNCPVITLTTCSEESQNTYADSCLRDRCRDTDVETIANGGSSLRSIESPQSSYAGTGMEFLMVPFSDDNRHDELTLSYDSGVDYFGGHMLDDWGDENDCNGFQESKLFPSQINTFVKSNSAIEMEQMNRR